MEVRLQLERILRRVQLPAVELQLQPEAFQATEELRIASGELALVIEELEDLDAGRGRGAGVQSDLLNSVQALNCFRFVSRRPQISSWCALPKMSR